MKADWVAASVRARAMAQRRAGAGTSRAMASQPTLESAISLLRESSYAPRLGGASRLVVAERAVQATVLWQLRVLAGWLPASGTALARAAAGIYEIENISALAHRFAGGGPVPEFYDLGALATAWPRLRTAGSAEELFAMLRASAWGDVGAAEPGPMRDALTVVWMRRLAASASAARPWFGAACVLLAARILLVDRTAPTAPVLHLLRPVLGRGWETASGITGLTAAVPPPLREVIRDVASPEGLWRAEARAHATVENDGFRLIRGSLPGRDVVLGAIAILFVDAWRVRAALTAAAVGAGSSEVLDAAA